jgi:hypothetical protein
MLREINRIENIRQFMALPSGEAMLKMIDTGTGAVELNGDIIEFAK